MPAPSPGGSRAAGRRAHDAQARHQLARGLARGAREVAGIEQREEAEVQGEPRPARGESAEVRARGPTGEVHDESRQRAEDQNVDGRGLCALGGPRRPLDRCRLRDRRRQLDLRLEVGLAQEGVLVERGYRPPRARADSITSRSRPSSSSDGGRS